MSLGILDLCDPKIGLEIALRRCIGTMKEVPPVEPQIVEDDDPVMTRQLENDSSEDLKRRWRLPCGSDPEGDSGPELASCTSQRVADVLLEAETRHRAGCASSFRGDP